MTNKITKLMLNGEGYEIREYQSGWQPGANTIAYFPFETDILDQTGNITLTNFGCSISDGALVMPNRYVYLNPDTSIGGSDVTISFWYYYGYNGSYNAGWNTFLKSSNGPHPLLLDINGYIGYYGSGFVSSGKQLTRYAWNYIVCLKSGTNQQIYVNNVRYMNDNNSFDNNLNPITLLMNASTSDTQGPIGKISNLIFENKIWTDTEISDYYNQTKPLYGIS